MNLGRPLEVVTPTVDGDVLQVVASAQAHFTGRQVHRLAGRHSERGIRNALQRLTDQGVVTRERVGSADRYALNREHLAAVHLEGLANLRRDLFGRMSEAFTAWVPPPEFAAMFGSAARGEMASDSDIDILVVRPAAADSDPDTWQAQIDVLARRVTGWTGNDARIVDLAAREVKTRANAALVRAVATDGIPLHGPPGYLRQRRPSG